VNEDSHSPIDGAPVLFVVADGVGGGASASYVSKELVSRLHGALAGRRHDAETVRAALLDADRAIAARSRAAPTSVAPRPSPSARERARRRRIG
jgi:serine/threonine protein phosphatase PrpC